MVEGGEKYSPVENPVLGERKAHAESHAQGLSGPGLKLDPGREKQGRLAGCRAGQHRFAVQLQERMDTRRDVVERRQVIREFGLHLLPLVHGNTKRREGYYFQTMPLVACVQKRPDLQAGAVLDTLRVASGETDFEPVAEQETAVLEGKVGELEGNVGVFQRRFGICDAEGENGFDAEAAVEGVSPSIRTTLVAVS